MNWKKPLAWLTLCSILVLCFPAVTQAAAGDKKVRLPDFPVLINGQTLDNQKLKYPFFVYKDITYLPLTWEYTRALAIALSFDQEKGLQLGRGGGQLSGRFIGWKKEAFRPDLSGSNPQNRAYTATLPDFPVTISNSYIDDGSEPFPLLEWNDVTYLPLTWKYAHDMLGLELVWDENKGLNVIGGQQQVLGAIYYDDKDYLYMYPELVTEPGRGGLKVKKSLEETPIWMTEEETGELRKRVEELERKNAGEPISLETKDDGLYYQGLRLMTKEQMTVSPGEAGMAHIRELKGARFGLSSGITLVSVEKITAYNIGRSLYEYRTFLILGKEVSEIMELKQPLDRIIANDDGSFWLVSNGMPTHGRIMGGSRRIAQLDAKGNVRLANEALNESDIVAPGVSTSGLKDLLTDDGKLLIYRSGISNDGKFTPKDTQGYYWLDTGFNVTKADALDALAKEESSPDRPSLYKSVYMGSDRKFYLLRTKNNTIFNYSDNKTGRWYDYEFLTTP
ncbi:hypothetical protein AV654_12335 [Paenibacillus elgii]|uniref:Copper amine oxidase-like N-terminal domain-containing protein n=1 Tax=Paenibacillus elgii TaxID=189691 RepID=A0A161SGE5_9BACL|nr:hypothetical protein [Paenibacillus elgii]KZE80295.1 hypothetical protein AV654_12335 [Paenibacillus elgii]